MPPIFMTLVVLWAVLTTLLIVLLIYRSTLSIHEEDQLFLDEAEAHMAREQEEIHARMDKIQMPMRVLGAASATLILVIAGMWIYEGLTRNSILQ
jgi:Tfp pilus assembly protein PilN